MAADHGPAAPLAVVRADAGPAIGIGHVMRCRVLAAALAARGWRTGFAVSAETPAAAPDAIGDAPLILEPGLPPALEPAALARRWPEGARLLVVDHYRRDAAFERACRPWARAVLAVDDLADRGHDADVVLDANLGRRAADYDGLAPGARRLIGPRWLPLRPEFARLRPAALARRAEAGPVRRVLVCLGGTDPGGHTALALETLAGLDDTITVDVVTGPAAPHLDALRGLLPRLPFAATLHVGSGRIADLMTEADLAIGAGGSMGWERCCLGLPSTALIVADNQRQATRALEAAGAALAVEADAPDARARLGLALETLLTDAVARARMAAAAAALVDGQGADRVARAVTEIAIIDETNEEVTP